MGYSQNAQLLLYYQEILDLESYFSSIHKTYNLILNFSINKDRKYDIDLIKKVFDLFFWRVRKIKYTRKYKNCFL